LPKTHQQRNKVPSIFIDGRTRLCECVCVNNEANMSNVHQYFVEARKVWIDYWAEGISRTTREALLAALRKKYFEGR
jgi:hypothetical protein